MICGESIRVVHPLFQEEGGGSIPTSPLQLHVGKISQRLAMQLNGEWHSRLPHISNWKTCTAYGAEYQGVWYAVAMWATPSSASLNGRNWYELKRFAIAPDAPRYTASRMLSVMRKMIKKDMPTVERLISYQDTEVHFGTIYKAAGWTCAGKTHKGGKTGWSTHQRFRAESNGKNVLLADKFRWELEL